MHSHWNRHAKKGVYLAKGGKEGIKEKKNLSLEPIYPFINQTDSSFLQKEVH